MLPSRSGCRAIGRDALNELDLSPAELAALASQDDDALRRLAGADVSAYAGGQGFYGTAFICSYACIFTIDTPQSGRTTCPGSKAGCGPGSDTSHCVMQMQR